MKENSDWMELWDYDGRWYDWNSATQKKIKITDVKRLINKLVELQENEEKEVSKISYLRSQLPPLYSKEEVEQLVLLTGKEVPKTYWEQLDLFTVVEPKRIEVNRLVNHPLNSGIYGESEDVTNLANQIRISGWVKPLVINLKGQILGGNRRKLAIDLLSEKGHIILEVDIEIKRFGSVEEELQFLILDNASREKTSYQKGREAQYLQMTWDAIAAKSNDSSKLDPQQKWFLEQWNAKKQDLVEKKGTAKIKSREVIGSWTGMSGDQHRKLMKVMWLIDVLHSLDRSQEAEDIIKTLNKDNITKAFLKYQEWLEENPTDYIYTGEQYGELSPNDKVEFCHAIKEDDPNYCRVRLNPKGEAIRVLRKFLIPVNKNDKPSKSKPKRKNAPPPKFGVGDRVIFEESSGVIDSVNPWSGFYSYEVTFDDQSYGPKLRESDLIKDDSWNSDDFGDITRQQETDGQGVIFQEEAEEPPDPDDFKTVAEYDKSYKKWKNKSKSGNVGQKPLAMEDFRVGEFYSNGHSVARLLAKAKRTITLQWIGMGDSPAPMGCDYYPQEGIEADIESEVFESLQTYRFDPFEPPAYVERKLQPGDLVCPKWNKSTQRGRGFVVGYSDGLVIYQEDESGEEHRLSDEKLFLLSKDGFSIGDRVIRLISGFPWQPQAEGRILALFSTCCDVRFEGFEFPCRLMYAWIDKAVKQLDIEIEVESERGLKDLESCNNLSELRKLLDSDWFKSLEEADFKAIIEDLWLKSFKEKF